MDIATDMTILRGSRGPVAGRRPKAILDARFCADRGCRTRLSRYNTRTHCYSHSAIRFPRTRGKAAE
jgi:hypothetical protein